MGAKKKPNKPQDSSEEVRRWEERFESFIELSSEWYWEQDEDCRFTLVTASSAGHGGIDTKRFLGTYRWDRGAVPAGDDGNWEKHKALLKARQPFSDFLFKRPDSKGGLRYISTSGQPVFDDKGRFRGYRGTAKDVTKTRRAEQLLALEHAVTRSLAEADSAPAALKAAIRAICGTEDWECGRYLRVDERAGLLRCVEVWGIQTGAIQRFLESSRSVTYAPGAGLAGRVWQAGQPLWLADVGKDPRAAQASLIREIGLHGAIFFPVMAEGKTIGVLAFNSREVREPEERLLQALRVIGSQIGQFVQRKQAEEVLRESEERFRSLTGLSSDMYWEQDEQFRFTSMSGTGSQRVNLKTFPTIGKKRWEQNYINMTADAWAEHIALLEAHKPFRDMELCRP